MQYRVVIEVHMSAVRHHFRVANRDISTPVYNDNQSAITLSMQYTGANKRVRYMLTRINWLMEKIKEKVYELIYLSSPELPAKFGTKLHIGEKRQNGMDVVMDL